MADKVHVISRRCVVLTWMRANRKQMWHVTLWNNIKLTLHHENNDDDKVMCASVWCEVFGGLLQCPTPCYMGGKCDNKEGDLYIAHMFPRILGLERGSDITEDDIIFKGSNLIICPKHSLYMRLIDCGSHDQTIYLQCTRFYIANFEAKIIFVQSLRYW